MTVRLKILSVPFILTTVSFHFLLCPLTQGCQGLKEIEFESKLHKF